LNEPATQLGLGRRALTWIAPALLCAVVVFQVVVTHQTALSPWKLGGFGMYSGVDSVRSRWLRVVVATPSGELPVVFDRLVEEQPLVAHIARNVRSLPDAQALGGLGQLLLEGSGSWADCTPARVAGAQARVSGHFVRLLPPGQMRAQGCRPLPVTGLHLELWRYRYDSPSRLLEGEKLAEASVSRSGR
jgi:hypothetical protein